MDSGQTMQMLGSLLLGLVLGAGGVFAWLSRRIKLEHQRVLHVEQARQQMSQQVTQARKQIEQLQRDCHELRLAVRPAPRPAPAPEPLQDPAEAARLIEPRINIHTGARMLADLIRRFGHIDAALAAWNAGEGAVRRAGGRVPDIEETQAHVHLVLELYWALLQQSQPAHAQRLTLHP